jgi:hypothetical protein
VLDDGGEHYVFVYVSFMQMTFTREPASSSLRWTVGVFHGATASDQKTARLQEPAGSG